MGKISLLDCTLRDGGYINDWNFGKEAIIGIGDKLSNTGVEYFEVGFMKNNTYDENKAMFPDIKSVENVLKPKHSNLKYVGMIDMNSPIDKSNITAYDNKSLDMIRVIFKKGKIDLGIEYGNCVKEMGYKLSMNIVSTDQYNDEELIETINKLNEMNPDCVAIVDTFGLIKKKMFLHIVDIINKHLKKEIALGYHAHNNLQHAFSNAESLVEMKLERDVIIDACVFGMGRGAGNLNLELFCDYLNENHNTNYNVKPMLEIMDEYLSDIYKNRFWGYSLPLYISAVKGCHPNYAIFYGEKSSLTLKALDDIISTISNDDKMIYKTDTAKKYYMNYLDNEIDDSKVLSELKNIFTNRNIVILGPGNTLNDNKEKLKRYIKDNNSIVVALNFTADEFNPDFIFSSNMRRFKKIQNNTTTKCIITSNMTEALKKDYVINFKSYQANDINIIDNAGIMFLKLLKTIGIKEVSVAGLDGYVINGQNVYYDKKVSFDFTKEALSRNKLIKDELDTLKRDMNIKFLTQSIYNQEILE